MFVRGIYEGENAACVASKLRLEGVFAIIPHLEIAEISESKEGVKKGTRNRDILILATAVYIFVVGGDAENRVVFLDEGVDKRRGCGVKMATEGCLVGGVTVRA